MFKKLICSNLLHRRDFTTYYVNYIIFEDNSLLIEKGQLKNYF